MSQQVLTIDIDERFTPCKFLIYAADCRFILTRSNFKQVTSIGSVAIWDSRRGHHLSINLKTQITEEDCILFQLLLGSDRKREAFNYRRMLQGKFRSYL